LEEGGQDQREIDELTETLYSCISFRKGERPDLERLRGLFIEEGMLINNNDDPLIFTIDQFVDAIDYQLLAGSLKSFSEREIAERTEIFGKIAHRFSTYEARFDPDDAEPLLHRYQQHPIHKGRGFVAGELNRLERRDRRPEDPREVSLNSRDSSSNWPVSKKHLEVGKTSSVMVPKRRTPRRNWCERISEDDLEISR